MTGSSHSQVLLRQLLYASIWQTNSKLFKAFHSFSETIQALFQFPEIQGLFEAGLEIKAGAVTLVDSRQYQRVLNQGASPSP